MSGSLDLTAGHSCANDHRGPGNLLNGLDTVMQRVGHACASWPPPNFSDLMQGTLFSRVPVASKWHQWLDCVFLHSCEKCQQTRNEPLQLLGCSGNAGSWSQRTHQVHWNCGGNGNGNPGLPSGGARSRAASRAMPAQNQRLLRVRQYFGRLLRPALAAAAMLSSHRSCTRPQMGPPGGQEQCMLG